MIEPRPTAGNSPESAISVADELCDRLAKDWQAGQRPTLEGLIKDVQADHRALVLEHLIAFEIELRRSAGEELHAKDYLQRFPDLSPEFIRRASECTPRSFSTLTSDPPPRKIGSRADPPPTRFGRYEVEGVLGEGAFGTVYKARDSQLHRAVAVKVPRGGLILTPAEADLFVEEARRAVQLEHPGIIPVYDVGQENGTCFIVSRLIDGESLSTRIARTPVTVDETVAIIAAVAEATHFAHSQGWVHRDIKPGNILLDASGKPHLADFGIAVKLEELRKTDGLVSGTPSYMAPEIVQCWAARLTGPGAQSDTRPDHRADIYSLGVVLYQLLTRRLPFVGESREALIDQILRTDPVPPRLLVPDIPLEVETVCLKALAKKPSARFQTAIDLRDALLSGAQPTVVPPEPVSAVHASVGGRKTLLWSLVSLTVLVLAVVVIALFSRQNGSPNFAEPREGSSEALETIRLLREILRERESKQSIDPEQRTAKKVEANGDGRAVEGDKAKPTGKEEPELPVRPAGRLPPQLRVLQPKIDDARKNKKEREESSLLLKYSNVAVEVGWPEEARKAAERMVELAGKDPGRLGFAYGQLGLAQVKLGYFEEAVASYEAAAKVFRDIYTRLGRFPPSKKLEADMGHVARLLGIMLMRSGNANKALERYENALAAYNEARALYEKHNRQSELMTLLSNLGSMHSVRREHQEAIKVLEKAMEIARKLKDTVEESEILINLGNARARTGQSDEAIECYVKASKLMKPDASYTARSALLANWSTELVEAGRSEQAVELIKELRRIARPDDADTQRILRLLGPLIDKPAGGDHPSSPAKGKLRT